MHDITRATKSGGLLKLGDACSPTALCALCEAPNPIDMSVTVGGLSPLPLARGRRLETTICADCIVEALAAQMGAVASG